MTPQSHGPYYELLELCRACRNKGKVRARKKAKEDAKLFNFETEKRLIDFISIGEFEELEHQNTGELDHDPDKGIVFDAYIFRIGPKYVYFAFYRRNNGLWIIKSFHTPKVGGKASSLTHTPFKLLKDLNK